MNTALQGGRRLSMANGPATQRQALRVLPAAELQVSDPHRAPASPCEWGWYRCDEVNKSSLRDAKSVHLVSPAPHHQEH